MAIDGLILNKISNDLRDMLPARINKIHQISAFEVLFSLRMNGTNKNLIISCHSTYNRIHFTTKDYPTGNTPTQFILNMRRYLEGGTIYSIKQGGLDRYLIFEIAHRNEIKDKETLYLHIELMGKYANIILVNEEDKIIDALKKIPPFENNKRTIQRGALFNLPEAQDKIDPFLIKNNEVESNFTAIYHGFSPLLSKEFEYRINHKENFAEIMNEIKNSEGIYIARSDETIFHLIPLKHLAYDYDFHGIHTGLDHIYYLVEQKERIKQATGDLYKFTRRYIKQLTNKLPKLLDSYDEALDCDKWKNYGDLLYTYQVLDTKGQSEVIVTDYEANKIKIPLDSKLDGKQNAKKHYSKYQKGRKGQQHILEQIAKCESEIEYFKSIEEQLEMASYDDAGLIKQDLVNHGYIHVKTKPSNKAKKKEILLNTIEYKNQLIIFGKNNIQNDYLTFKVTKGNDTWFHAKDYHGAHVSVNNMSPDEDTLRLCAKIAAYYSKGRLSSSVPVNYCLGKTLKKIPGSKLGLVQLSNYKTIYIDPDQSLIESLLIVKR